MIKLRKQQRIKYDNIRENAKRLPYTYKVGEKVLVSTDALDKYSTTPYEGPYEIVKVNSNGTLRIKTGAGTDTINIRHVHPYKSR